MRRMQMLTTDAPEADIRQSGFIVPAFLTEEVLFCISCCVLRLTAVFVSGIHLNFRCLT
jgi:hypothetical protein